MECETPIINLSSLADDRLDKETVSAVFRFVNRRFSGCIEGFLLAGSRVYGRPHADSDLDIVVALSRPVRQRIVRRFGDLLVDISALFIGEIQRAFRQPHAPGILECIARGVMAYDRTGSMHDLQRQAKRVYADGPPPINPSLIMTMRTRLTNDLKSLTSLVDDDVAFGLLSAQLLLEAARVHCGFARIWLPNPKDIFAHLPSELTAVITDFVGATTRTEQLRCVRRFVEAVLGTKGGLLWEWETPLEQLVNLPAKHVGSH